MGHCLGIGDDRHGGEFLSSFGGHGGGRTNGLEEEVEEVEMGFGVQALAGFGRGQVGLMR